MRSRGATVVVGAGVAGVTYADALRAAGDDVELVLIDAEAGMPYDRPPLSKALLDPGTVPERPLLREPGHYRDKRVELLTGRAVVAVDTARRTVTLADGEQVRWGRLVLATGRAARVPDVPGVELDGVVRLRSFDDALALRARLDRCAHVAIVGAGFVGAEVATAARARGLQVTVVEQAAAPLARLLPAELGARLAGLYEEAGARLITGRAVVALDGAGDVERVRLDDGGSIDADLVLLAVGTTPLAPPIDGVALAGPGVAVDASLRHEAAGVRAIGDVAVRRSAEHGAVVVEQWTAAVEQARHLAAAGDAAAPFAKAPYAWSQQFGRMVQLAGELHDAEAVVRFADGERMLAIGARGGTIAGAFAVDLPRHAIRARQLIERRAPWDEAVRELADAGEVDAPFAAAST
jgi:NADPH-dependent 2,4-dienoyl-CoA reductase/sulfur reductase-like enzyme